MADENGKPSRPQAAGATAAIRIDSHRLLIASRKKIIAALVEDPDRAKLLFANAALAFKDSGVELSPAMSNHVLHTVRQSAAATTRREQLVAQLREALGVVPKPSDPQWLATTLFTRLKVTPVDPTGHDPVYQPAIPLEIQERLRTRLAPRSRPRLPARTSASVSPPPPPWRLDLSATVPVLPRARVAPKAVTVEGLWFYLDAHELVRPLLELAVLEVSVAPTLTREQYDAVKAGKPTGGFLDWIDTVTFAEAKPHPQQGEPATVTRTEATAKKATAKKATAKKATAKKATAKKATAKKRRHGEEGHGDGGHRQEGHPDGGGQGSPREEAQAPMSTTSNFDYCVQTSIAVTREIFHLAFKNEALFPHNVGPFDRPLGSLSARISVVVLDDETRPADLTFEDDKHIRFRVPNDITVEIAEAPDRALSRITLSSTATFLGRLDTWPDAAGAPVLGVAFSDIDAGGVTVENLTGLPVIGAAQLTNAIHARYPAIPHRYTAPTPYGTAVLLLYDGTRDATLIPPHPTSAAITATLVMSGGDEYLTVTAPLHVDVPTPIGHYVSFGTATFSRKVTRTDTTITVDMSTEPSAPALATVVALDTNHPARDTVISLLTPKVVSAVAAFGVLTAPAYSQAAAESTIRAEIAAYLKPLRFGLFTPRSNEPGVILTDPVGFLLVATETLAILMTRRHGGPADDVPPDDFRASKDVALAVGRDCVIAKSDDIVQHAFPGVNGGGGYLFDRPQGKATLKTVHVAPEDDGAHGENPGHLWVTGDAEVHIDCWPDPDVSFSGPVFIDATEHPDDPAGCWLELQPRAGKFDVDESCCDVLIDILIPVVGWIMLAVVESLIDEIGGQIADETAGAETQLLSPLPKVVIGIAEVECCLETIVVSDQGFVFPGSMSVRREGRSFQDLHDAGSSPRPDSP